MITAKFIADVTVSGKGMIRTVALLGHLGFGGLRFLMDIADDALKDGPRCVIFELSGLRGIDPTGVWMFTRVQEELRRRNTEMFIAHPSLSVTETFLRAGYDVGGIYETRAGALAACLDSMRLFASPA